MKTKLLLLIILFFLTSSFKPRDSIRPAPPLPPNLNISFLLDLSDRIDPKKNPGIYQRDVEHIKSVEAAFVAHVQKKKIMLLNDQMQVFFEPIPSKPDINKLSQQLMVYFDKTITKGKIAATNKTYADIPSKIYQSAIKDNFYVGSDTWRFFKSKVKKYCIKNNYRNILVILTDGYMFYKGTITQDNNMTTYLTPALIKEKKLTSADFKAIMKKSNLGFIPATTGLNELEVLVLGINPSKGNPFEEDVISQYWSDWLKAMNVKKFSINTTDLPVFVDPVIRDFIK